MVYKSGRGTQKSQNYFLEGESFWAYPLGKSQKPNCIGVPAAVVMRLHSVFINFFRRFHTYAYFVMAESEIFIC